MNKRELVRRLSEKTGLTIEDSKVIIDTIFNADPRRGIISEELARGEKVVITGFGKFTIRKRKARTARNPRTGASVKVPPRKRVAFKTSGFGDFG